jgi:hypothetical protein
MLKRSHRQLVRQCWFTSQVARYADLLRVLAACFRLVVAAILEDRFEETL